MRLRVVCGLEVTIATFCPTRRFTSVDLPAFGRPSTATNPALKSVPITCVRGPPPRQFASTTTNHNPLALDSHPPSSLNPAASVRAMLHFPDPGTPAGPIRTLRLSLRLGESSMPAAPHIEKHFTASEAVRDVVIGMADGLTVPFALAAGMTGAVAASPHASTLVVTAGLAEIAAGSIAMGLGGYLAAKTDSEHYASERERENRECVELPDVK